MVQRPCRDPPLHPSNLPETPWRAQPLLSPTPVPLPRPWSARCAAAVALCLVGIAVLISPLAASGVPSGLLFALAAGVSWAAGTIYLKWAQIVADPIATAAWQLVAASVVTAATAPVFEGSFQLWP